MAGDTSSSDSSTSRSAAIIRVPSLIYSRQHNGSRRVGHLSRRRQGRFTTKTRRAAFVDRPTPSPYPPPCAVRAGEEQKMIRGIATVVVVVALAAPALAQNPDGAA